MRPLAGVALALHVLAGCFSDTAPQLTGAGETTASTGTGATTTSGSTSEAATTSSSSSSSSTGDPTTSTATTAVDTCPMGQTERPWYLDGDGDGYGAGDPVAVDCVGPAGTVDVAGDCDDGAVDIHPGAIEVCNALVDDDCDGLRDEHSEKNPECGQCSLAASDTATYWACSVQLDFFTAEAACQGFGGPVHLATPRDAVEHALVRELALQRFQNVPSTIDFWLGIHRVMSLWDDCGDHPEAAAWQTLDGAPLTYLAWSGGEPNNSGCSNFCVALDLIDPECPHENCVELGPGLTGAYNDGYCGPLGSKGYVCKAPL